MFIKQLKHYFSKKLSFNNKQLSLIKNQIKNPKIWKINETNTKKAAAIGIFSALLPIPFQMLLSAYLAILFEANLTLSIILVWITNPITIPFVFYTQYKVGSYFLTTSTISESIIHWSQYSYWDLIPSISIIKPFLLGVIITSTFGCLFAYILCSIGWKIYFYIKHFKLK